MTAVKQIEDGKERLYKVFGTYNEAMLFNGIFEQPEETRVLFACRIKGEAKKNHCAREKSQMRSVFQSWQGSGVTVDKLVNILVEMDKEAIANQCGLGKLYRVAKSAANQSTLKCTICANRDSTYIFTNCQHQCVCEICGALCTFCPKCKTPGESKTASTI